jgi:hypothetical protein
MRGGTKSMWRDDDECLTLVCRCVVVVSVDVSAELSPAMILSHDDDGKFASFMDMIDSASAARTRPQA